MTLVTALLVYILPGIVATLRRHPKQPAIWVITITVGWTVVGWIAALMWALNSPTAKNDFAAKISPRKQQLGTCKFCGEPCGSLSTGHRECAARYASGVEGINNVIARTSDSTEAAGALVRTTKEIAGASFIGDEECRAICAQAWTNTLRSRLHDHVLSEEQEQKFVEVIDAIGVPRSELERTGSWELIVKGAVVRDLLNDVVPKRIGVDGDLGLNFLKSEQLVWAFQGVRYLEDRVYKEYVGRSRGVSVRVAKGVYYRTGASSGHAVEHQRRVLVDAGLLAVTTKSVYFKGQQTSLRLPFAKIVSFQPFNDGVGVIRDGARAKLQVFVTNDAWFTYNLVTNLARLA